MPSPHRPPTTLYAILWIVPWRHALSSLGGPSNRLPGCTTPLCVCEVGVGLYFEDIDVGFKTATSFFLFPTSFLSLSIPLNIPLCLFALPHCCCICISLFLSVSPFIFPSMSPSFLSCFLVPCCSLDPSLLSCVIRKGLPDPVHINQ